MGATKEFAASVCFFFAAVVCVVGQDNGSLKGVTRDTAGANVAGVEIVFTNQVTSEAKTIRSDANGTYSIQLIPAPIELQSNRLTQRSSIKKKITVSLRCLGIKLWRI